ncbi:hypothetical protein POSPLADRAFT_1111611, partial [Postia placenta MAD-698-R-SB12]
RYSVGPFLVRVHLYVPPWSHTPTSKAHVSQKLWPVQNACVQEAQPHGQGSCKLRVVAIKSCGRCRMRASRKHNLTGKAHPFLHLSYGLPYGLSYGL